MRLSNRNLLGTLFVFFLLFSIPVQNAKAQRPMSNEVRWLRVGALHSTFAIEGAEFEMHRTGMVVQQDDGLRWQADFANQDHAAAKSMWIGTTHFADPVSGETYDYKVVIAGPRSTSMTTEIMPVPGEFKLLGRFAQPLVYVDDDPASDQTVTDVLDEDPNPSLISDRMIYHKMVTSIGITVTRKLMAFTQENHDNYFIYDYVFKNTGIIDTKNTKSERTLTDCIFHFQYRYAFGTQYMSWLPHGNISWGRNTMNQVVGTDPMAADFEFRAIYAWFGLHSEFPVDSWGCPNFRKGGALASPSYVGAVVLHADKDAHDKNDDPYQPTTTMYIDSDGSLNYACAQYDINMMRNRYAFMNFGHPPQTHADQVGDGFADKWGPGIGGTSQGQGFGPYTLEPGDSIRIVIAEAVAGLKREKSIEVGSNWFRWYSNAGNPKLILPNGTETTDYNDYKKQWCLTAKDSLFQTFRRAIDHYNKNYMIPAPPQPPALFTVKSGGDRISLTWDGTAPTSSPNFNGYCIYRAIDRPDTLYEKIFECNEALTAFDDISAMRGRDYYYYIQSKDDGSLNDVFPGRPLYSSRFFTKTNKPAHLRRQASQNLSNIRVVPNPYHINARSIQFGEQEGSDRLGFYGLPPVCTIKIYTERGNLVETLDHTNGSGDEYWHSTTSSGQIVVSGLYIAVIETPQGEREFIKFVIIR